MKSKIIKFSSLQRIGIIGYCSAAAAQRWYIHGEISYCSGGISNSVKSLRAAAAATTTRRHWFISRLSSIYHSLEAAPHTLERSSAAQRGVDQAAKRREKKKRVMADTPLYERERGNIALTDVDKYYVQRAKSTGRIALIQLRLSACARAKKVPSQRK
uniref:Uncharacterized protein n=1 Tax=Trichogramma kaykai TaxID=54128 RepID=A0ABD2XNM7_9HYME